MHAFACVNALCLLVPVQIDISPGSHIAGRFLLVKWKPHNRFRLHARVSNLLANQQAFLHEQASARMQIFCSLNTRKDQYGGKLHVRIRANQRLCNVNAALHAERSLLMRKSLLVSKQITYTRVQANSIVSFPFHK